MKKLIPFDYAKYQAGAKAVYRESKREIIQVVHIAGTIGECLISAYSESYALYTCTHYKDGAYLGNKRENEYDLMLEIDVSDEPEKPSKQDDCILDLHRRITAIENFISQNYPNDLITTT